MKIRPVGAELFLAVGRTEGQTDTHIERNMMKLTVAFRNFTNALKKWIDLTENGVHWQTRYVTNLTGYLASVTFSFVLVDIV